MKEQQLFNSFWLVSTTAVLATQPAWADTASVTAVRLNPTGSGIEVLLETPKSTSAAVFTSSYGETMVADIMNTRLRLPKGNTFRASNPTDGITAVMVMPLDAKSIRVTVIGKASVPRAKVVQSREGLVLSFLPNATSGTQAQSRPANTHQQNTTSTRSRPRSHNRVRSAKGSPPASNNINLQVAQSTSPAPSTQPTPAPRYLNPSPNPLQFPTRPDEVRIQGTQPITLEQAFELARRNNRQLQIAQLTLERDRAALRQAEAALYPTLNAQVQVSNSGPAFIGSSSSSSSANALSSALGSSGAGLGGLTGSGGAASGVTGAGGAGTGQTATGTGQAGSGTTTGTTSTTTGASPTGTNSTTGTNTPVTTTGNTTGTATTGTTTTGSTSTAPAITTGSSPTGTTGTSTTGGTTGTSTTGGTTGTSTTGGTTTGGSSTGTGGGQTGASALQSTTGQSRYSSTDLTGTLALNYNLYTSGGRRATIRSAEEQVRYDQLQVEITAQLLRQTIATDYYNLQGADQQVLIYLTAVRNAEASLRDAQAQERAGTGTRFDTLRAQVQLATQTQNLIASQAQQQIARRQLVQDLSLAQPVTVTAADPVQIAGLWNLSLEQSIVLAFKNRAELEQFLVLRNQSEQNRRLALSQLGPQVSLFANYNVSNNLTNSISGINPYTGRRYGDIGGSDTYSVGGLVSLQLFDGGAARSAAAQQEANKAIAETNFANTRNQIRFSVEQDYANLQANLQNVQLSSVAVAEATESLRLARLRFQAGVGTQTDVISAENDLTNNQGNQVNAILNYNRSLANIQRDVSSGLPR